MNQPQEVSLSLNVQELNGIMAALGNMSYNHAAPIIQKIQQQVAPQLGIQGSGEQHVDASELRQ